MKRKSIAVAQYLDHKLLHVYENNRLVNLRWATAMEQAKNQKSKQKFRHCRTCCCS